MSKYDLKGDPTQGYNKLRDIVMLTAAKNSANKAHHNASSMDRTFTFNIRKIPTGIFHLDWYTHGGIPINRITRIYGRKNSGKTTTMLKILRNAQNYCRYCLCPLVPKPDNESEKECGCPNPRYKLEQADLFEYISSEQASSVRMGELPVDIKTDTGKKTPRMYVDISDKKERAYFTETYRCAPFRTVFVETEHKLDKQWAIQNGVDPKSVIVIGGDWAENTMDTAEEIAYSDEIDILFIDTLSMLVSADTIKKGVGDPSKIANSAVLRQKFAQKLVASQYSRGVNCEKGLTVVFNSQVRTQNIGSFFTTVAPSDGHAVEHTLAMDIEMKHIKSHSEHQEYASMGEFGFTIKKNHTGGSYDVSGTFKLWLDPAGPYKVGDTDDCKNTIQFGRSLGSISSGKGESTYVIKSRYRKSPFSFKTLLTLEKFLRENPFLYEELRQDVLYRLMNYRSPKEKKKGKSSVEAAS